MDINWKCQPDFPRKGTYMLCVHMYGIVGGWYANGQMEATLCYQLEQKPCESYIGPTTVDHNSETRYCALF